MLDFYAIVWEYEPRTFVLGRDRDGNPVELHPDVSIRVLYQRDYLHLLVKYGLEPPSQLSEADGAAEPLRFGPDVTPLDRRTAAESA